MGSERPTRFVMVAITGVVLLAAAGEVARSLARMHAVIFAAYVGVGDVVLAGGDPYGIIHNTWPPFFGFVAAALALASRWSAPLALLGWQVGGALAIWGCCRLSAQLVAGESTPITFWPRDAARLAFASSLVIVPFLMMARLFQEHLQHTQVNAQVLFFVLLAFHLFRRRRAAAGGLSLAVGASTKAMPILFLPYLVYKRAWRELGWTALFLGMLNVVLPWLAFGPARAGAMWHSWRAVAGSMAADPTPHFMNQSLLAALKRLFSAAGSARDPIHYAVADWPGSAVWWLFAVLAVGAAAWLAWRFRAHPRDWSDPRVAAEVAILLGAVVVVDPLAWKAHYVALIVPYTYVWWALRRRPRDAPARAWRWVLWWGSFVCLTLSAPALVGRTVRNVLESLNVILIGTFMLLGLAISLLDETSDIRRQSSAVESDV